MGLIIGGVAAVLLVLFGLLACGGAIVAWLVVVWTSTAISDEPP